MTEAKGAEKPCISFRKADKVTNAEKGDTSKFAHFPYFSCRQMALHSLHKLYKENV
jgi:hypothetical protein